MGIYAIGVWLHLLSMAVWVGGMVFISVVLVPVGRRMQPAGAGAQLMRVGGRRFLVAAWPSIVVLGATGVYLAWHGGHLAALGDGALLDYPTGRYLAAKVGLVAVMVLLSAFHDFLLGPRAAALALAARSAEASPTGPDPQARAVRMRRLSSWVARVNLVLALAVVLLGVRLVRG